MTGRNEPCPCGSGKTYEKCRIDSHRSDGKSKSNPEAGIGTPRGAVSPYAIAKIFEETEQFKEIKRREPGRARLFWTPGRVATLGTEEPLPPRRGLPGNRCN